MEGDSGRVQCSVTTCSETTVQSLNPSSSNRPARFYSLRSDGLLKMVNDPLEGSKLNKHDHQDITRVIRHEARVDASSSSHHVCRAISQ